LSLVRKLMVFMTFLARETVKVGVIYAARGQENQKEILKNTKGSFAYESFIQGLGEVVDLKSHLGFQAGLKHKTDGEHAIYYSDPLIEVMFHVATMMPTSEEDEQVLNKKRYFVEIIFLPSLDMLEMIM